MRLWMMKSILRLILLSICILPAFNEELIKEVDKIFSEWNNLDSPGCAVGIVKDGELIYKKGYGSANLDYSIPITPSSVFYVASISKQFTAACIALLAEQKKLNLNDNIRLYLPEMPEYDSPILIRHLLYHTSGIRDYFSLWGLNDTNMEDVHTESELLELISRQKGLNFYPGERYSYSNSAYFLLALIVKRISGISIRDYAEKHIFKPLGMNDTRFHDDSREILKNRVVCYSSPVKNIYKMNYLHNWTLVGSGGVISTVEDLYLWDQNFYYNTLGEKKGEFISLLTTPGMLSNGKKLDYALGLRVAKYRGLPVIRHAGGLAGFQSEMIRFPNQKFSVICLANVSSLNAYLLARKVADIYIDYYFQDDLAAKPLENKPVLARITDSEMKERVGYYHHTDVGDVLISKKNKKLEIQLMGDSYLLIKTDINRFSAKNAWPDISVDFLEKQNGKYRTIRLSVLGRESVVLESFTPEKLQPSLLKEYPGGYYSEELLVKYEIALKNETLFIRHTKTPWIQLIPSIKDRFTAGKGWLTIKFHRNANKEILGFELNADDTRGIQFSKNTR